MIFEDRVDAGRRLAEVLTEYKDKPAVILAIPRGGVVIGNEISKRLNKPLDIIVPRKIGAPGNPELAIGAVAGKNGILLNRSLIAQLGVSESYIENEVFKQRQEIERRESLYRKSENILPVKGKVAIVVDDGLATGFTARAAIFSVKSESPSDVILAVPIAPPETIAVIQGEVDKVVCLHAPELFYAIGQFYFNFEQVSDAQVIETLEEARKRTPKPWK
jgi:predicted phosphoribosyltransferase